jgi:formylglycine-generating enzyme required for sulfatase activity
MPQLTLHKEPKQATYFTEMLGDVGLDMVSIEAGEFLMGSPDEEIDRSPDEGPQHKVQVPAFFMGRYPVTQAQWCFVADTLPQIKQELTTNPSESEGDDLPVESVSWHDAVEFCDRLSRHTKRQYRLPSEAEWEYACRAGTTTAFYYGQTLTPTIANYRHNISYNNGPTEKTYPGHTTTVRQYPYPNAWGLSDMHGNVFEWCADDWQSHYEGTPSNGTAWTTQTPEANSNKVIRSGAWDCDPQNCRSAHRNNVYASETLINIGFRIVCSPASFQLPKN